MNPQEIGKRIGQARKEAGMTLQQVAQATGLARSTIQRYEQGVIANVKMPVVQAIGSKPGLADGGQ